MSLKIDMENVVNGPDNATNFGAKLIRLIFKADQSNRAKLAKGFPNAVNMVQEYKHNGTIIDLPYD